jgi:hypothetical protein
LRITIPDGGECALTQEQENETAKAGAARRPYTRPELRVYGPLEALTLTISEANRMNDMFGPLKT